MSPFAGRRGIDKDVRKVDKRADLMVSAPIEQVSNAIVENGVLGNKFEHLRLEIDAAGQPIGDGWPLIWVFRLGGQSWAQVSGLSPGWPNLEMAKEISEALATRCFCLEITDDVYGSFALFDRGAVEELFLYCTHWDLERILPKLGLTHTPDEEAEEYEEVDYFHSTLRADSQGHESYLAQKMGFFLHLGEIGDRKDYGLVGVDAADLERIDLVFNSG